MKAMTNDFVAFILTHGRPDNVITYNTIKRQGYTGRIILLVDDEDPTLERYQEKYGQEVYVFSKDDIEPSFDTADTFHDKRGVIIYARNACFKIAQELGIKYFIQLDDDYTAMHFTLKKSKGGLKAPLIKSLDKVFACLLEFMLQDERILSVAMSQGGDLIGGASGQMLKNGYSLKRKAMNSFICSTERPFTFVGRINEDVNTYTSIGSRGGIFFTVAMTQLVQKQTQSNKGGMTETYLDSGTYLKSFYSVMMMPSAVKVAIMGELYKRLHHRVSWNNCVPQIISEHYRKQ